MPIFTGGGSNVTSANIVDGEIVNADINAAAAIATSKISNVPYYALADVTLGSTNTVVDSGTFTAKANLRVLFFSPGTTALATLAVQVNSDTGANYEYRIDLNGTPQTYTSAATAINLESGTTNATRWYVLDIYNVAGYVKTIVFKGLCDQNMHEGLARWTTTAGQITSIQFSGATFNVGSRVVVLGMN